ncbi:TetR/AcrR family transcriptional regulator [Dietzia sp. ANT_WB102]|uniref:TetR/AcrR family transcriptional regulator n=1 Tax=Dietzia sp. ANT_WB102 TaxID=2597345 RepID=UPI00165DC1D6|nr:TetR/AcrR family transcriptional regulator [Dietzia sp. ANT_WB102]
MSRQAQIKFVAAKLFVENGVAGTSVRDIADGVGMLSGSLYHHFPSKDAIAFTIVSDFLADLISRYESVLPHVNGMREEFGALVHSSIDVATAHPYATEIYQNERSFHGPQAPSEISDAVERAHHFWTNTAEQASRKGDLRAEMDPLEFARMLREGVWWSVRYHRESLAETASTVADTLLTLFLDGATPRPVSSGGPSTLEHRVDQIEARLDRLARHQPN